MTTIQDVEGFAKTELAAVLGSKTFKAVVALELAGCGAFVDGVVGGTIPLTRQSIEFFVVGQIAAALVLCWRHTQAGIEAKLDGKVDPAIVKAIEQRAQDRALATLEQNGHGVAAQALKTALSSPAPTQGL